MRSLRTSALLLLIAAISLPTLYAQDISGVQYLRRNIPVSKDADTNAAYIKRVKKPMLERHILEAYKSIGARDDKWNARAEAFLQETINYFTDGTQLSIEERVKEGTALTKLGCKDPMVLYCLGVAHEDNENSAQALKYFKDSYNAIKQSKYPEVRKVWAANRIASHLLAEPRTDREKRAHPWIQKCETHLIAAMKNGDWQGAEWQMICASLYDGLNLKHANRKKILKTVATNDDIDPWMINMLAAKVHRDEGWAARGSGYAYTVRAEGMAVFAREINKAGDRLVAAHDLHPDYPQAAAELISITMAGFDHKGMTTRDWFDKAVTARFDFDSAYHKYRWAIRPRWEGSIDHMWAFGLDCLDTGRFETIVPWQQMRQAMDIASELKGGGDWWKQPGRYAPLKQNLEGHLKHYNITEGHSYHSWLAAVAYRCGEYADSAKYLKLAGDKARASDFTHLYVHLDQAHYDAEAKGGKFARNFDTISNEIHGNNLEKALTYAESISQNKDLSPSLTKYTGDIIHGLKQALGMEDGKWTSAMPDDDFTGYMSRGGKWTYQKEPRVLMGDSETAGLILMSSTPLRDNFEISGNIHFTSSGFYNIHGGIRLVNNFEPLTQLAIYFYPLRNMVELQLFIDGEKDSATLPAIMKANNHFTIMRHKDDLIIMLNGKAIEGLIPFPAPLQDKALFVGLGGSMGQEGMDLGYTDVKMRTFKKTKPPHFIAMRHSIEAQRLSDEGDSETAIEHLKEALSYDLDKDFATYITDQQDRIKNRVRLVKNEWVDITPDHTMQGWTSRGGTWTSTNGIVKGVCSDSISHIYFQEMLTNYEVTLDLELKKGIGSKNIGVLYGYNPRASFGWKAIMVRYMKKVWTIEENFGGQLQSKTPPMPKGKFSLHIKVINGHVQAFQNDVLILEKKHKRPIAGHFGLVAVMAKGATVEYSNIKIKQL